MTQNQFVSEILAKGEELYRDMPWRLPNTDGTFNAYNILVSELMLQQTQVSRVVPKFAAFIEAYPSVKHLANATLQDVLTLWSGLGYNRRAKYLHEAAQVLAKQAVPWHQEDLIACKGIGQHTAAAILTYAYNQKHAFIETNIRTVYIHYFFQSQAIVTDTEIMEKVTASLTKVTDFRRWYWSLMDVGAHLKSQQSGHLAKAKAYKKQSAFSGSRRQLRGKIIAILLTGPKDYQHLKNDLYDERFDEVLEALISEQMVTLKGDRVLIV